MTVKLEISEDLLKDLDIKASNLKEILEMGIKQMKIEKALQSFKERKISLAKAAELADIPLSEMMLQASARGIKPIYDQEMIDEEIQ
ncbi:MAG: hypothetical protein AYK19_03675 [Theionarchaea archaeon DG-70-1]|nr:MAG: hypothetical protein AYK19_03675 [Theionarchaea archaeon DG-70-1]